MQYKHSTLNNFLTMLPDLNYVNYRVLTVIIKVLHSHHTPLVSLALSQTKAHLIKAKKVHSFE